MMLFRKSAGLLIFLCMSLSCYAGGLFKKALKVPQKEQRAREQKAPANRLPIVYHPNYDVTLGGIEKLHPFDSAKYSKVYDILCKNLRLSHKDFYRPQAPISHQELLKVHSQAYLDSLNKSATLARISEISLLKLVPNFLLQKCLLSPMRYATAGTLLATDLALEQGWAINLSGGYHHAKTDEGGGFCVFGDIQLAAKKVLEQHPDWCILIVDLDAHQGNGHEEGLKDENRVFIFDMYRQNNYPNDYAQMERINYNLPLGASNDQEYLDTLMTELPAAIAEVRPHLIIYNAGTDIYKKDPLGAMNISAGGIKERDAFVFEQAERSKIPVVMLLSGGYTKQSAGIVADSVEQIIKTKRNVSY